MQSAAIEKHVLGCADCAVQRDELARLRLRIRSEAPYYAAPPALHVPRVGTATVPIGPRDAAQDESIIGRRLAQALLCAPCLARICILPLDRVERVLDRLQGSGNLRMLGARCEECRKTTIVYTPDRS